jgi:hypothetical protein
MPDAWLNGGCHVLPLNTSPDVIGFSKWVTTGDEAACVHGNDITQNSIATMMFRSILRVATSLQHLPLIVPPSFWAAFFVPEQISYPSES